MVDGTGPRIWFHVALLDYEGSGNQRKVKLSQLAEVILVHPNESVRRDAIAEAALRPAVHSELWEKYRDQLPSDSSLRWELTHDRGFTETGAAEFIPVYRATVSFAQLASYQPGSSDEAPEEDDPVGLDDADDPEPSPSQTGRRGASGPSSIASTRSYSVPLISGGVIGVEGAFPISEADWDQFIAVLTAMRPGLVRASGEPDD